MRTIQFGIIGGGLMGREFASAAARWCHLPDMDAKPVLAAVCDQAPGALEWFSRHLGSGVQTTTDYRALLANRDIEAVYCAVPHHLHREIYCAVIEAGKNLLGEKPFGIDQPANDAILAALGRHPGVLARCSSEFPFHPCVQRMCDMIERGEFGPIIEVNAGFLHSSDLDPEKPINWKRKIEFNGEYGCMGDLGMHVCHVPFRAGWVPGNVRAVLSKLVKSRPDGKGGRAPCETWDNATLLCEVPGNADRGPFPMTLKTQRIAPGERNTWYIEILGMKACARFSTRNPRLLEVLEFKAGQQDWRHAQMGQETAFKSVTGPIFEFGFSDGILQMIAAFVHELAHGRPLKRFAGCVTPEETALSHRLFTAALRSQERSGVMPLD
jgi:predicted dehydrogenase